MPEDNRSMMRALLEKITMMQLSVTVIGLGAMAAVTYFIVNKGAELSKADVLKAFITYTVTVGGLCVLMILVIHFVFRSVDVSPAPGESNLRRIINIVGAITPMQGAATLVGLLTIGGLLWLILGGAVTAFKDPDQARGMITFAVAIVTVAIALILLFYIVFASGEREEMKERFTFGKDVLMVFVGILGTIMGFYYGAGKVTPEDVTAIQNSGQQSPASASGLERQAFGYLIKQDFDGAEKAFDLVSKANPPSPNIANIKTVVSILTDKKPALLSADDVGRKAAWKDVICQVARDKLAAGMNSEFEAACPQSPSPSPSGS
jgi:hypothetical protein